MATKQEVLQQSIKEWGQYLSHQEAVAILDANQGHCTDSNSNRIQQVRRIIERLQAELDKERGAE